MVSAGAVMKQMRAVEQHCKSRGCLQRARWKCMIVMPPPPLKALPSGAATGGFTLEADRARLFSGVSVCDKHRGEATIVQVLGPYGYQAICGAFRALGKKAPSMGDLAVDFESIEDRPILAPA